MLTEQRDYILSAECNNLRLALPFINAQLGDFRSNPFKVENLEGTVHWLSPRSVKFLGSSLKNLTKMFIAANMSLIMIDNAVAAPTALQNKNPKNLDFLSGCRLNRYSATNLLYDQNCLANILLTTETNSYLPPANFLIACAAVLTYSAERVLSYFCPSAATSMANDLAHSIVASLEPSNSSHVIALITDSEFATTRQLLINQGFMVEDRATEHSTTANSSDNSSPK